MSQIGDSVLIACTKVRERECMDEWCSHIHVPVHIVYPLCTGVLFSHGSTLMPPNTCTQCGWALGPFTHCLLLMYVYFCH